MVLVRTAYRPSKVAISTVQNSGDGKSFVVAAVGAGSDVSNPKCRLSLFVTLYPAPGQPIEGFAEKQLPCPSPVSGLTRIGVEGKGALALTCRHGEFIILEPNIVNSGGDEKFSYKGESRANIKPAYFAASTADSAYFFGVSNQCELLLSPFANLGKTWDRRGILPGCSGFTPCDVACSPLDSSLLVIGVAHQAHLVDVRMNASSMVVARMPCFLPQTKTPDRVLSVGFEGATLGCGSSRGALHIFDVRNASGALLHMGGVTSDEDYQNGITCLRCPRPGSFLTGRASGIIETYELRHDGLLLASAVRDQLFQHQVVALDTVDELICVADASGCVLIKAKH